MKYIFGILCVIAGIILGFELIEIKNSSGLYLSIYFMLATIFFNMKTDD